MLSANYTAKVLDLEDVIISKVENDREALKVYLELPVRTHKCPSFVRTSVLLVARKPPEFMITACRL